MRKIALLCSIALYFTKPALAEDFSIFKARNFAVRMLDDAFSNSGDTGMRVAAERLRTVRLIHKSDSKGLTWVQGFEDGKGKPHLENAIYYTSLIFKYGLVEAAAALIHESYHFKYFADECEADRRALKVLKSTKLSNGWVNLSYYGSQSCGGWPAETFCGREIATLIGSESAVYVYKIKDWIGGHETCVPTEPENIYDFRKTYPEITTFHEEMGEKP